MLQFDCRLLRGPAAASVASLKMLESSITESSKAYYYAIMKYRAFTENLLKMQESSMTRASLLP